MDDHRVDPAQASTLQRVLELALESCRSVIEGDAIVEAADPADGLAPSYVPFTGTRKRPTLVCREKLSRGTRCNATPKRASLHPTPYHAAVPRSSVLERDARFVSHAQRAPSHRSASRTYRPAVPHGGWCMPWRKVISRSRQCRESGRITVAVHDVSALTSTRRERFVRQEGRWRTRRSERSSDFENLHVPLNVEK